MPPARWNEVLEQVPDGLWSALGLDAGPLDAPIRSEVFGMERFERHGISLGLTHKVVRERSHRESFTPRLQDNIQRLRSVNAYIGSQARTGYDISPAAEWLLENFHLLEAQFKEVDEGLPSNYFKGLPVLVQPPLAGLPRVYGVAWAFVAHTDGAFDESLLVHFLNAYQQSCELRLSELWALPTTLRVVLMENLRRLADRVAANKAARELANRCCDDLEHYSISLLGELAARMRLRGVEGVFLAQMSRRLQTTLPDSRVMVKTWLQTMLPLLPAVLLQQRAEQAADNLSVSNSVTSLRTIGDADWPEVVMRTNVCTRLLLGNAVFRAEHSMTRETTLHGIEQLAKRSGKPEAHVTETLLDLMAKAPTSEMEAQVPAYWLGGAGGGALRVALGLPAHLRFDGARVRRVWALPLYLGAIGLATAALMAWLVLWHGAPRALDSAWLGVALWLLVMVPASEAMVALVNRLASESLEPRRLPRLAFKEGLPAEHRVAVVIPCMLVDALGIEALARRLHLHYLANPEPLAQFVLLTDHLDAATPTTSTDAVLLAHAVRALEALNQRYPVPAAADAVPGQALAAPRFALLHRERRFSRSENAWIGWERKRGKLEALVARLTGTGEGDFVDLGTLSHVVPGTPYVVTLDADTQLPPGRLRSLVGIAAHPSNQPVFDPATRTIVKGYGVLQPRVSAPLPGEHARTFYHWLFAGQFGIDTYSATSSEVYQDVFGQGTFTGKGLFNVAAVHQVLSGRFPDGQVLSHDLLEGALVRCATVTDVTVLEDGPHHPETANARIHRWTRGDWQLLPFMVRYRQYGISFLNLWKMLDNLRRSLVAPACLALLLMSVSGIGLEPAFALLLVLLAYTAGPFIGAVAGLVPGRPNLELRYFYACAGVDFARVLALGVWQCMQLLRQSMLAVDAVWRSLYRLAISRSGLLEWTTAASVQAGSSTRLSAMLRTHAGLVVLTLAGAVALAPWVTLPAWATAWVVLWFLSPLALWLACQSQWSRRIDMPDAAGVAYLQGVAQDTWRFFERCVTAQDHCLPPDNLQVLPFEMLAHRTSPTNIGLYLLSCACAAQAGWISMADLATRLKATLDTLDKLPRHEGHFLNWYDTQTLAVLLPAYVSTVDSGNLSGHLLTTAQACLDFCTEGRDGVSVACDAQTTELQVLARRMQALALAPDYRFLYSTRRRLFHIGYRVREQELDNSFYDLLASESRLTSLLAIAKGDVDAAHWGALGRIVCLYGVQPGLKSWSGSMFEYLMPSLMLDEPRGSLLQSACEHAVGAQRAFGEQQGVPWGVSESAYAGRDSSMAYQYAPQGVPSLALRRTPLDELVVAPYATLMALMVSPHAAIANLQRLEGLGMRREWGFMEALDYTPVRQTGVELFTPVGTFMAHHQGMALASLTNLLHRDIVKRWGMADPHMEAVSSLLHERVPKEIRKPTGLPQPVVEQRLQTRPPGLVRQLVPGQHAVEPSQLLSNGHYGTVVRANGAGASHWGTTAISRFRDDALRDAFGHFVFCRELGSTGLPRYSITRSPAPDPAADYRCSFQPDRAIFHCTTPRWESRMTVWVSPEDDIEFRQVELHNTGDEVLELELSCCWEVALNAQGADEAHPAFSKLFVHSEWLEAQRALLFQRNPRVPTEPAVCAVHFLAHTDATVLSVQACADRQVWLGRNCKPGRDSGWSQGMRHGEAYFQGAGPGSSGLDPVAALSVRIRLAPFAKAQLTFASAAAAGTALLHALIDKYQQSSLVLRASSMSSTLAGIRLRSLQISPDTLTAMQSITTALLFVLSKPSALRRAALPIQSKVCDKRLLWRMGLSGDRPILLVSISVLQGLGLVRALSQTMRMWAWAGLGCDLVVLNAEPASYHLSLQRELTALCDRLNSEHPKEDANTSIGMWVLRDDAVSDDERSTLHALARMFLDADGRPLLHHVQAWSASHDLDAQQRSAHPRRAPGAAASALPAAVRVSTGAFAAHGEAFRFLVSRESRPLRPWVNVLANDAFGTVLSEAGGGFTWAGNSRLNQLTPWSNDPVADLPGEWLWLQDLDASPKAVWSLSPDAWALPGVEYTVSHTQGMTRIRHRRGYLEVEVLWLVDVARQLKQVQVLVHNQGAADVRLRCTGMVEWVLGAALRDRMSTASTTHISVTEAVLLCSQREQAAGLGGGTAFWACLTPHDSSSKAGRLQWTTDRRQFFDSTGALSVPDLMADDEGTTAPEASGRDPCAALSIPLDVPAGQSRSHVFLMGYAADADAALALAHHALTVVPAQRIHEVTAHWNRRLGQITITTPDPLMDALVNRWLLYQTLACRMAAKAGFYQAGGATGFRDQLQDAMALVQTEPATLRAHIKLCASRQFAAGDVQHWWHDPGGAGVRTRMSDDLLWLPQALTRYLQATDDDTVLDEQVPFLEGPLLEPEQEDAYFAPPATADTATVYEHAARALDHSLQVGAHGLPLMGTGDWNDGMNAVGPLGKGESVWLAWFLVQLVRNWAPVARARGEQARAQRWELAADGWHAALAGPAWDGQWYARAFFDDGSPLGRHTLQECRIDLIAQAWAVLSQAAPPERAAQAMQAAHDELTDPALGLIKLLAPPLQHQVPSAGYIQSYPPGVRENGGQYSHAGVWALMAMAQLHREAGSDLPYRYFCDLSPAHRSADPVQGPVYGLEPYAMAGDVYGAPPYAGRGGWSWYTGSAAWMYRAATESIFGLEFGPQRLCFRPCFPAHWDQAHMQLLLPDCVLEVRFAKPLVEETHMVSVRRVTTLVVGEWLNYAALRGVHRVELQMPAHRQFDSVPTSGAVRTTV
ncbi:Glycosyl hydrolase 94 [Comamonadaceae bacterium]